MSATTCPCGLQQAQRRGQHEGQADEAGVDDGQVGQLPARERLEVAHVGAVEHDDARVGLQLPGELAVADVDGVDLGRAALEQAVGEAAGAGTHVDCDQAADVQRKVVEGGGQLETAAADVGQRRAHGQFGGVAHGLPRLVLDLAVDGDLAGHDQAPGLLARLHQPTLHEQQVQALFLDFLASSLAAYFFWHAPYCLSLLFL